MIQIKEIKLEEFDDIYNDIVELQHENNCIHFPNKKIDKEQYTESSIKSIKEYMIEGKAFIFVALENNRVVGFLWSYPKIFFDEKRMFVNSLIVKKEYRRQHIGKLLIEKVEEKSKELNYDSMYLFAASFNENALKFYKNQGYIDERIQLVKKIK